MTWFPSLPCPASHLQSNHESSMLLVCACLSWKGIYLPGIKTESRNERQGNRQKFPSGSLALAEAGEPGKGSGSPNLSPLLKWPKPSVSITELFSPREFPTGQDGQSRRERLLATGALRPPSSATRLHFSHSTIHTFWVSPTPAQTTPESESVTVTTQRDFKDLF